MVLGSVISNAISQMIVLSRTGAINFLTGILKLINFSYDESDFILYKSHNLLSSIILWPDYGRTIKYVPFIKLLSILFIVYLSCNKPYNVNIKLRNNNNDMFFNFSVYPDRVG